MSNALVDKVYIGLDNAPAAFDIKGRILGTNGTNLEYIRSETGAIAILKGDKFDPLHLTLHHTRAEALAAARSLALNLIETIRAELAQWTAAQAAAAAQPSMSIPPPSLTTSSTSQQPPPVAATASASASLATSTPHPSTVISPMVSVAPGNAPLMTMRQPTVLQLLPSQQQYVLNQENGQLIPIVQPGVQVSNSNFTSLPIAQQLGTIQQPNFGTQIVDISGVQPMNVTQLRLSGVPSSMSMILPNGLTIPQGSVTGGSDTTTVSSAMSTPVVCAAPISNSSQKILYSTDKTEKDVKYHIQGADSVQWAVQPSPQTMIIPYQQLQDLTANQAGIANLQSQQYVSLAPVGGLPQTSLPLTAAQLQQLQASGTIMPLHQKPTVSSTSLINIISTGQASSPINHNTTPVKNTIQNHESRGQKRLSDGNPSQLQLRPIAPAGSAQDKTSRDTRSGVWSGAVRENVTSMGMKINPAHGTIIHVSSGQQTSVSAPGVTPDGQGMFIRQIDRNSIQLQPTKDSKQDKIQSAAQNVQMITVPPGMTVLQNPLSLGQMQTVLGQPNSQVYMIPTNQSNLVQSAIAPGLLSQQVLQTGQNVTVMQPNQLTVPNNVQYNTLMPMNVAPNTQYVPAGINLNNPLAAQQINAALANQQLNPNLTNIPIVQANPPVSPMTNIPQTITVSQSAPLQQIIPQNAYVTANQMQSTTMQPQYLIQPNSSLPMQSNTLQYNIHTNQTNQQTSIETNNQTSTSSESESTNSNNNTNQSGYISSSSQQSGYAIANTQEVQQTYAPEANGTSNTSYSQNNQNSTQQSYSTQNSVNTPNSSYTNQSTPSQVTYTTQSSNPTQVNHNSYVSSGQNGQNVQQGFSPSTTPAPQSNQPYTPNTNLVNLSNATPTQQFQPGQPGSPYPNATGQNMAAYANNQYPYNNGGWFRAPAHNARFGSPQASPYTPNGVQPTAGPMPVPAPTANYNYWQDS